MGNKENDYPRLLVIANNSFSLANSNGRTLGSMLEGWPKDRIAQFCISSDGADFNVCDNYYCVTDADVMNAIIKLRKPRRRDLKDANVVNANSENGHVKHRKTSLKMLARNFAWMSNMWQAKDFKSWIEYFNPDIVLLQSGDSFFMHNLAIQIARKSNAKLVLFNTEGNQLFKKDYFAADRLFGKLIFRIYQTLVKYYFHKFIKNCSGQIYGNELLRHDFDQVYGRSNSIVIYTGSQVKFEPKEMSEIPSFLYAGNMGFDRPKALVEFAETISEIDSRYKLDVYGFAKNKAMESYLQSCPAIRFHGAVPYSKVVEVMEHSDFLIHVECQDEKWAESLKYGFSTKIADSISSGKIFVLYASPDIACAQYIQNNGAGIFASTKNELKELLQKALSDQSYVNTIRAKAQIAATQNHNFERNKILMRDFLSQINQKK